MSRVFRAIHFAVTLLIGVPIVMWTVTGFTFTCFDFQKVRGTADRAPAEVLPPGPFDTAGAVVRARAARRSDARVTSVQTRAILGKISHFVTFESPDAPVLVDDASGETRDGISEGDAREIALRAFRGDAQALTVNLMTSERDAPFVDEPTYRVVLSDAVHTEVFVAKSSAEIVSWRNDWWRRFDALLSLHVFGFIDRDSPAQWPLRIAGLFAAIASLSGLSLLVTSVRGRARARRRRRSLMKTTSTDPATSMEVP